MYNKHLIESRHANKKAYHSILSINAIAKFGEPKHTIKIIQ